MNWLKRYHADILALEKVKNTFPTTDSDRLLKETKEIFAPLMDESIDPGDLEKVTAKWWKKYKSAEIVSLKKQVAIQRKLASLYQRLERATQEQWEAYAWMCVHARFLQENALLRMLFKKSGKHVAKEKGQKLLIKRYTPMR